MKPIHIFADQSLVEQKAMQQFYDAMACDFAVAGAVMPDVHTGYSLPIGSVVATTDMIVPAWVGYDIGCGMLAAKTTFTAAEIRYKADTLMDEIYSVVPVGSACHDVARPSSQYLLAPPTALSKKVFEARKGALQLGTLGSGNHFIEVGYDEADAVWIIIHSGSRGTGHGIAGEYMKLASGSTKAKEGHFGLPVDSELGLSYLADLTWALDYALANRFEILELVCRAIHWYCSGNYLYSQVVNRNHNHAEKKGDLWVHRKGATHAEAGMMGVIPGNMRDGSFIVRGKGNPDALWSSSHGAGRVMSRSQAKQELSLDEFTETMEAVTARITKDTLDESPMAYKSIVDVMAQQENLVEVVAHIRPIINIKG